MDGVVHNPDILQLSNEADLLTGFDTINSVEHKVYMEKRAENQEADIQVLFFLPTYIKGIYLSCHNFFRQQLLFNTTNQLKCTYFVKLFNRNLFYAGLRFEQLEPTAFRN